MQTHRSFSLHHARTRYPSSRAGISGRWEANINPPLQNIVSIAPEFHTRGMRASSPEAELAVMNRLGQFLTSGPDLLLDQLTAACLEACDVSSAAVVLLQQAGGRSRLHWASVAGNLVTSPEYRFEWEAAMEAALESQQPGIFMRLAPAGSPSTGKPHTSECLVVPWQTPSHTQGALVVFSDCMKRCLDPTDLRIAKSLTCFAQLAAEKKEFEDRSARGFASAARLANEIAHEINNPLQTLMNSLHLMACDYPVDMHLKAAREEVRRVAKVMKTILELGNRKNPWT
ncbi:MAG: hypothetical protein JSS87_00425 [Acidobacteria bacterium]|nr:hypothetical protein [Acidobacteriota bacterium]